MRFWWLWVLVLMGCPKPEPKVDPIAPFAVGPAPLRRLTNSQYLNALTDVLGPEQPVLEEFPADSPVGGFDNAAEAQTPSELRVARYQVASRRYAELATRDAAGVARLMSCTTWTTGEDEQRCLNSFLNGTARRLFRRPLKSDEVERFVALFATLRAGVDFEGASQLLLEAMLQSPQFLYRPEVQGEFDGYALASRLSFLLWDSGPDDALLRAAELGELNTEAQVREQASRLLNDPKAKRTLWNFHRQWLALERLLLDEHSVRTPEVDPLWTTATQASALTETRKFVENVMLDEGTLSALLTSRRAWLDAETARLYGVTPPTKEGDAVSLDATQRSGLLTRVAFLAGFSHRGATSPPIRGNGVNLHLLCRLPTPPPPGIDTTPPMQHDGPRTNRMLFEERTSPPACAGCHRSLNGFGFGFEHYTASGAWQTVDHTLDVDAHGELFLTDVDGPFDGAIELSETLARSRTVHECATKMWIRYALGRAPSDDEQPWVGVEAERFFKNGGDVKALLLDVVTSPTFMQLPEVTP